MESSHSPLKKRDGPASLLSAVKAGLTELRRSGVLGPYSLIVPEEFQPILAVTTYGYPFPRFLEELLDGKLIVSPNVEDAFLLSTRGGDFRLLLAQDLAIGYGSHDSNSVKLFFSESFTFQVINPEAVILIS